jgi:proline dehydrogenase
MLKNSLLYLAQNPRMKEFVTHNRVALRATSRFVAGETLDDAIQATRTLNKCGIQVALDLLGENVADAQEAHAATQDYIKALDLVKKTNVDANVSIKLTALGLDIADDLCVENVRAILDRAQELNIFICIDMEGSPYTKRTVDITLRMREHYDMIGTVIQSYLYRSYKDIEQLIAQGVRVRLVKGAYQEAESVAFQEKYDVDKHYLQLMEMLLARGNFPAIASHDEHIIDAACKYIRDHGISKSSFEFQMLYGIRRDLQEKLVKRGYNMRVYVPYGSQWYPYLMRRMAERPANLMFVMSNILRF